MPNVTTPTTTAPTTGNSTIPDFRCWSPAWYRWVSAHTSRCAQTGPGQKPYGGTTLDSLVRTRENQNGASRNDWRRFVVISRLLRRAAEVQVAHDAEHGVAIVRERNAQERLHRPLLAEHEAGA